MFLLVLLRQGHEKTIPSHVVIDSKEIYLNLINLSQNGQDLGLFPLVPTCSILV